MRNFEANGEGVGAVRCTKAKKPSSCGDGRRTHAGRGSARSCAGGRASRRVSRQFWCPSLHLRRLAFLPFGFPDPKHNDSRRSACQIGWFRSRMHAPCRSSLFTFTRRRRRRYLRSYTATHKTPRVHWAHVTCICLEASWTRVVDGQEGPTIHASKQWSHVDGDHRAKKTRTRRDNFGWGAR